MLSFKVAIFLVACLPWAYGASNKYCNLCDDHTMCIYSGVGESCTAPGASGISEEDKKEIVDVHNWLRRIVASGRESRGVNGGQPKAANMRKMVWDDDLSEVAQRWANQCNFQHDSCRNDPRWVVGQNIYWKWMTPTHPVNWTDAILSWYNEVDLFNPQDVNTYRFDPKTGHYTQVVWHNTYAVGCGRKDYGAEKIYVCNYGPTGNWLGKPMYAVGEPCSQCPDGSVCEDSLCVSPNGNLEEGPAPGALTQGKPKPKPKPKENAPRRNQANPKFPENKKNPGAERTRGKPVPSNQGKPGKENENQTKDKKKEQKVSGEDNEIVLDEKTRKEIDKVHQEIEKLLKMFIQNIRNFRKEERS